MHADGVGIGVETDQQQVNGCTAAKTVLDRRSEIQQSLVSGCRCQRIITAVGSTALMLRIHRSGSGIAGVYPLEIAETKTAAVHRMAEERGYPLRAGVEPE